VTPDAALEQLVTDAAWMPDWDDVLGRADSTPLAAATLEPERLRSTRRRWALVALAILIAVTIPLTALAVSEDWWFVGAAPDPAGAVGAVDSGVWNRMPWTLVAYDSESGGVCYGLSINAPQATRPNGTLTCAFLDNSGRPQHSLSYLTAGSADNGFPRYAAGAVQPDAASVALHMTDGSIVRTQTLPRPATLHSDVRFFVTRLPAGSPADGDVTTISALGAGGDTLACVAVDARGAQDACRP
jgi:hypothetical protein